MGKNIVTKSKTGKKWEKYVECLNDVAYKKNHLIGRKAELERTIQVLCRRDKNNPLHIGESGVGKTAITYGLARMIEDNEVHDLLKGAKIYAIDLGGMIAGTQYRGEFEKRFKQLMEGILEQEKPIVYFDEIHNIVGAGSANEGSFDVSNMLKSYLTDGKIRFIGATTYEEYKKYFEKDKSLIRRFQNIDIKEPTEKETVNILEGLKKKYEDYHHITYKKGVMEYAVRMSSRFINERFLPDKAIDLIDEAGAYRSLHPTNAKKQIVDTVLIDEILAKICNIPKQSLEKGEKKHLAKLEANMTSMIFGQEEAIKQVTDAIKFSKAGLSDENKPLSTLLFVGATGVGKTEVARQLAEELGISLIRFDMSEYSEKHTVAKLIGSPAGYVGYEEGGLLTEEVRKNPHAVLLLDEIEKAHTDIYNTLLQVMDYATLTDNQGRKADFRNIVLIMTSNAGASKVGKDLVGFGTRTITNEFIMEAVKKIFKPEFRNRLTKVVVFNNINDSVAKLITTKKINELKKKLSNKNVDLVVNSKALKYITNKGISKEYGAREIDRVINSEIKTLLVDELLFGTLRKGGKCSIELENEKLKLICK